MTTYVIGDVQGCHETLLALVGRLKLHRDDRLWFVGDLVNRGPASLDVLRWVRALGDRATVVLGNHDLHLLARAQDLAAPKRRDTLDPILAAPDRDELIGWLSARPLIHREGEWTLVHAGLPPAWTVDHAVERAGEVAHALCGPEGPELLASLREPFPDDDADDREPARSRFAALALTRLRVCTQDGVVRWEFKGPPEDAPAGFHPWFRVPGRRTAGARIVFGHWSTLGDVQDEGVFALDTGCVYGGTLTALRLEDGAVFQEPSREVA